MKKLMMIALAALATVAGAEDSAKLVEARKGLSEAISDTTKLTEAMQSLTADEQITYVAELNAALAAMPGSKEEKAAASLNANKAAVKAAAKGNVPAVVAKIFATATPSALTIINESFATDLFSRAADKEHPFTDAEYTQIASNLVASVAKEADGQSDAGVRTVFAALMMLRAAEGSPANLQETLLANIPDETTRKLAASEWIPAAMATDDTKNYDAMLAYCDEGGESIKPQIILRIANIQRIEAMLHDLQTETLDDEGNITKPIQSVIYPEGDDSAGSADDFLTTTGMQSRPRTGVTGLKWNPAYKRGNKVDDYEPQDYQGIQH